MYVHVWYNCHNLKVGCIEEYLLSTVWSIMWQSGNGPHSRAKVSMTYQVESQTRTTLKTACWPPSSFPWAALLLLLLLLPTGPLLLLLQLVPEGLAWSAGAACELRCASEAGPTHLWSLTDRAGTNQRTTPIYLSAQLARCVPLSQQPSSPCPKCFLWPSSGGIIC